MSEYMDYNDFNYDYKSKRQKIMSNIGVALSVIMLVSIVIWVNVRKTDNARTDFKTVTFSAHSVGEVYDYEKSEFNNFYNALSDGESFTMKDSFVADYPDVVALVTMSKADIAKNQVYSFEENGYITLATVYVVEQDINNATTVTESADDSVSGTVGIDFTMMKTSAEGDAYTVSAPVRFSVRYFNSEDVNVPYIALAHVSLTSFRTSFYTITFDVKYASAADEVTAKINLTDAINKDEANRGSFGKYIHLADNKKAKFEPVEGGQRTDFYLVSAFKPDESVSQATVVFDYNDKMYLKCESVSVLKLNSGDTVTVSIN